ncbi:tudor domain-containing protein 7-like isoform X2 [Limulus polyphemus]|uniref:Tudor domain-containing protein 7-like isoform X2 n=1 Tax=Limulus polyphemus TaxID=6850 RepID=A0ABM1SHF4_LIMPO|nr:tudor domain-containing protein 7-like isoform X2 [Limulus polyphemus]
MLSYMDMENEKKVKIMELGTLLRSVLQSSKGGIIAANLEKDYADLVGEPIPFKQLGYSSLEDLFHDLSEFIKVSRTPLGELKLQAVCDLSTRHIANLVARQKDSKSKASLCKEVIRKPQPVIKYSRSLASKSQSVSPIAAGKYEPETQKIESLCLPQEKGHFKKLIEDYARRKNISCPVYRTIPINIPGRKRGSFWACSIQFNKQNFTSYPTGKPTKEQAEEATAKVVLDSLLINSENDVINPTAAYPTRSFRKLSPTQRNIQSVDDNLVITIRNK